MEVIEAPAEAAPAVAAEAQPVEQTPAETTPTAETTVQPLKALSLWQPWASLITLGEKKIETRGWSTDYRGPVAILATVDIKPEARDALAATPEIGEALARHGLTLDTLPLGCILCVADLVDCIEFPEDYDPGEPEIHFGDFRPGRFGFKLENVRALPEPIDCPGAQGLFNLSDERAAEVWAAVAPAAETAPGPEAAVGAADASAPPATQPEPVGSRTVSYEEQARHLREIEEAERVVAVCEEAWEDLKKETKDAKDDFDKAVEKLRKIITAKFSPGPLFDNVKPSAPTAEAPQDDTAAEPEVCPILEWGTNEHGALVATSFFSSDSEPSMYEVHEVEGGWSVDGSAFDLLPEDVDDVPSSHVSAVAAQAWCQSNETRLWAETSDDPAGEAAEVPQDDNAWRAVRLDTLTPKIKPGKLKLLAENNPPITTMGEMADWQAKHGAFWAKNIKRFGEATGEGTSGEEQIVEAQAAYFAANPRGASAKPCDNIPDSIPASDSGTPKGPAGEMTSPAEPSSEPNTFAEDTLDKSTITGVATREKALQIDVAQLTSGRWVAEYSIAVGTLDARQTFADASSHPSREDAARDAIATVRAKLAEVRGELKGRAEQVALEITWALDAGEQTLTQGPIKARGKKAAAKKTA